MGTQFIGVPAFGGRCQVAPNGNQSGGTPLPKQILASESPTNCTQGSQCSREGSEGI